MNSAACIDGVYAADENGNPEFHHLPPPENDDVARVATLVGKRVESLMKRRGLGPDGDPDVGDALSITATAWINCRSFRLSKPLGKEGMNDFDLDCNRRIAACCYYPNV